MGQDSVPSAFQVANFFLAKIDVSAGDSITNLKLQKLCYFAQARSLVEFDRPVFSQSIQAWAHGPVVPELYRRYRKYLWHSVDSTDVRREKRINENHAPLLEDVWAVFSPFSAKQLERIAHAHAPWRDAYGDRPVGAACDVVIKQSAMKAFYSQKEQKEWWEGLAKRHQHYGMPS